MSEEESYDPLSTSMKHIMLKCGILECQLDNFKQSSCVCGHSNFDHLECTSICLNKQRCICERFLNIDSKTTIPPQKQGKLPKTEEQKQIEDNQLNTYIQQLAKM